VTDSLAFNDHYWRAFEQYLRYASHATAAITAANSPTTPIGLRKELLERWARMHALAESHREAARKLETQ
jgi:hypothetical protein